MSIIQDASLLKSHQYKDANNLNARIQLHQQFSTNSYDWFQWVFDQFDIPLQAKILELGSGSGNLWVVNADRISDAWWVIISDFSIGMVGEARNSLMDRQFSFAVCDVGAIPHDDNYFDAVIANHFLYHVRDRVSALKEIRRVLKPGSRFYATTVGDTHLGELNELVRRFHFPARKFIPETLAFTLENGKSQLASVFPKVRVLRQNNDLKVTEVEPLVNYILSCIDYGIDPDQRDDLFSFIQLELRQNNSEIFIHKDSGLFEAC